MDKLSSIEQRIANVEQYLLKLNHFIDGLTTELIKMNLKLEQLKLVEPEQEEQEWWQ